MGEARSFGNDSHQPERGAAVGAEDGAGTEGIGTTWWRGTAEIVGTEARVLGGPHRVAADRHRRTRTRYRRSLPEKIRQRGRDAGSGGSSGRLIEKAVSMGRFPLTLNQSKWA